MMNFIIFFTVCCFLISFGVCAATGRNRNFYYSTDDEDQYFSNLEELSRLIDSQQRRGDGGGGGGRFSEIIPECIGKNCEQEQEEEKSEGDTYNPEEYIYVGSQKQDRLPTNEDVKYHTGAAENRNFENDIHVAPYTKNFPQHPSAKELQETDHFTGIEEGTKNAETDVNVEKVKENERILEPSLEKTYSFLKSNPSFLPLSKELSSFLSSRGYPRPTGVTNLLAVAYGAVCAVIVISLFAAVYFYRKVKRKVKEAEDVDYPAYGITGPAKDPRSQRNSSADDPSLVPGGDRHLAHSAQMYHYHHQKQQIKSMEREKSCGNSHWTRDSTDSEEEENDYAVYECPGLATTGEMEVNNPMFQDEDGPMSADKPTIEEPKISDK